MSAREGAHWSVQSEDKHAKDLPFQGGDLLDAWPIPSMFAHTASDIDHVINRQVPVTGVSVADIISPHHEGVQKAQPSVLSRGM